VADVYVRRPLYGERRYIWSTTRDAIRARNGGQACDFETVCELVDGVLERCRISAAFLPGVERHGHPEIQGFVVEDPQDETVEFLHLRKLYLDMSTAGLAARVVKALLRDRESVTFRRPPAETAALALREARCVVKVKPRSV
jgi:hypothetical protein